MGVLRRYRMLIAIYVAAACVAAFEVGGRVWRENPYADGRDLPPEADAALALWPDEPAAQYTRAIQAVQLRFDLEESLGYLQQAVTQGMPVEERILFEYVRVLAMTRAASPELDAAQRLWRRHFPDSKEGDPLVGTDQEFPARNQAGSLWSSSLSPDGQLLATLHRPGTLVLAEVMSGSEYRLEDPRAHRAELPLGFSPGNKVLATLDEDHAVTLWDLARDGSYVRLVGHADRVYGIAFSADERRCATGSRDRSVRVWDTATGQLLTAFEKLRRPVTALAFSPDNRWLAGGNWSGEITLWNLDPAQPSSAVVQTPGAASSSFAAHQGAVTTLVFAPQGGKLISGSRDATVRVWDIGSPATKGGPTGFLVTRHEAAVTCAMFLSDGVVLVTAGSDRAVQFWDGAARQHLHAIQAAGQVFGLGYSAETNSLGVATWANNIPSVLHYRLP